MKKLHYLKIQNFKVFGQPITIELDQPSVLIGPNNSGKTTVIQALALWHLGIKKWYQERFNSTNPSSIGLNRLDIPQVPVLHTKYFWQKLSLRKNKSPITMSITVGVEFKSQVEECSLNFKYSSSEVIYFQLDEKTVKKNELLNYINQLKIEMLYPMAGIATEEPLLQEGRINVLIGEGKTSEVLRNFCYQVVENDDKNHTNDWQEITQLMKRLFQIDLKKPTVLRARGSIELKYTTPSITKNGLDIAVAGRGQQQVLLLISYLFVHKNTVLLLDEPDAHLEILRQRQILTVLNYLADKNDNQIIMATHSSVILENAIDSNLVMLIDGEAMNLAKKPIIKKALKDFGLEHYYKAKISKAILYVEGSTDIEMLKALAELLNHPAKELLTDKLNCYYIKDSDPDASFDKEIDKATGDYRSHKEHFYALKACVPALTGIALFDGDNRRKPDEISDDLATVYWKKYQLENYFIMPQVIEEFVKAYYAKQFLASSTAQRNLALLKEAINQTILVDILNNDAQAYAAYLKLDKALQRQLFINNANNKKLSEFLDHVLEKFSELNHKPRLLNKGRYYELIPFLPKPAVDSEVTEKLDLLVKYLRM
ncbi:MAG: AAA family ATPase [Candidatus Parabeggiatoa sp. nov. 2]|nr:MAG: AAA family ATPase [Gammaproteobacteria bacterium]